MKPPKILLLDIETLPIVAEHIKILPEYNSDRWGLTLRADVNSVLCFGYKFLDDKKASCLNAWDFKSGKKNINDDTDLLKELSKVAKDADAMVTHNGKGFDIKFINTRLTMKGLPPLPEVPQIDTKQVASNKLFFIRNRLDYLAEKLSTARKMENGGWQLWVRLALAKYKGADAPTPAQIAKDKNTMSTYCKQDVIALEKLFLKLRPFVKNLPNRNFFDGSGHACTVCGSTRLHRHGTRRTLTGVNQRYLCTDCGTTSYKTSKSPIMRR
jgi:DNA polymerase elongation subunit (family B)